MNLVLRGLTWRIVLAFLDDALVLGRDFEDHIANLRSVFQRFREYDLKFKPKKCELFRRRVEFFGRQVSGTGVEMGDEYIEAIKDWTTPANVKDIERFFGFANYHRDFIACFAQMAQLLYGFTGRKPFVWEPEQQTVFEAL